MDLAELIKQYDKRKAAKLGQKVSNELSMMIHTY